MTVQYNQLVLTGGTGVFFRLLLKWRGCVFKLIYMDIIIFCVLYAAVSCIYRLVLPEPAQRTFEYLVSFTNNVQQMIPVAFILGFYIQLIYTRFWYQFMAIPWGLKFSVALVAHLSDTSERARMIRRTSLRYLMGSLILTLTRLNVVAKKRFPNPDSLVAAGIFTDEELELISRLQPVHLQPFIPVVWATSMITMAEKEGYIRNHHALVLIITEINSFRQGLLNLFLMDYVCVPLVYTQVVTLSVYCYFLASLIGRQYIMDSSPLAKGNEAYDLYIPFFTLIEFIIYVGWLKVAETLINPMGEDDEDLDVNEVIDYNWKCSWCIVDGMKIEPPALIRDMHWDHPVVELPHTEQSRRLISQPYRGSVYDLNLGSHQDLTGSVLSVRGARASQDVGLFLPGSRTSSTVTGLYRIQHSALDIDRDRDAFISASTSPELLSPRPPMLGEPSTADGPHSSQHARGASAVATSGTIAFTEPIEEETEEDLKEDSVSVVAGETEASQASTDDTATIRQLPVIKVDEYVSEKGDT